MHRIIGKIPISIEQYDELITMVFSDGSVAIWGHDQDCCEDLRIIDVNGDWKDLLNRPLLVADERTNRDFEGDEVYNESAIWTFYTFRGIMGSVDVRWLGESNGRCSEEVSFCYIDAAKTH